MPSQRTIEAVLSEGIVTGEAPSGIEIAELEAFVRQLAKDFTGKITITLDGTCEDERHPEHGRPCCRRVTAPLRSRRGSSGNGNENEG